MCQGKNSIAIRFTLIFQWRSLPLSRVASNIGNYFCIDSKIVLVLVMHAKFAPGGKATNNQEQGHEMQGQFLFSFIFIVSS